MKIEEDSEEYKVDFREFKKRQETGQGSYGGQGNLDN